MGRVSEPLFTGRYQVRSGYSVFPQPLELATAIATFPPPQRPRGRMNIPQKGPLRGTHSEGKVTTTAETLPPLDESVNISVNRSCVNSVAGPRDRLKIHVIARSEERRVGKECR